MCSSATTGAALESLSRSVVWLDRGVTRRLDRGFAEFEPWREQVLEQERREQHKLGRKIVTRKTGYATA